MQERPAQLIADVLLNQRVMAGIGNVYKSEVLFACGVNPFTPVAGLSDDRLTCLIATGRKFLLANVHTSLAPMTTYAGYQRNTTGRDNASERLWVYGRVRSSVPPLPDAHQAEETRGRGAAHLLVPEVPGGIGTGDWRLATGN